MNQEQKHQILLTLAGLSDRLQQLSQELRGVVSTVEAMPIQSDDDLLLQLPELINKLVEEKLDRITSDMPPETKPAEDAPPPPVETLLEREAAASVALDKGDGGTRSVIDLEKDDEEEEDEEEEPVGPQNTTTRQILPEITISSSKDIPSVAFAKTANQPVQPMRCADCDFKTSNGAGMKQHRKHRHEGHKRVWIDGKKVDVPPDHPLAQQGVPVDDNGHDDTAPEPDGKATSLGEFMRARRKELGISATKLATMTQLMPSTIHRMEQEKYAIAPREKSIKRVAKALQCDENELRRLIAEDIRKGGVPAQAHETSLRK